MRVGGVDFGVIVDVFVESDFIFGLVFDLSGCFRDVGVDTMFSCAFDFCLTLFDRVVLVNIYGVDVIIGVGFGVVD